MVNEIESLGGVGAAVIRQTLTPTKAQKRWRLAYLSIIFSNAMLSACKLSKKMIQHPISDIVAPKIIPNPTSPDKGCWRIDQTELTDLVKGKDLGILQNFNGVTGLAEILNTSLENGIMSHDIEKRKLTFGSNTNKRPPPKRLFRFVMEAKDSANLILLACATLSLGFGFKDNGAKEGWYEGGSIFVAVFLIIAALAVSKFRQERQFDQLSKTSGDIKICVIREGNRQKISIFDVVVGDVVILTIGDQVPADGLFIDGHCLLIDESSLSGESNHIEVDAISHPFLFSGSKVADGHARMLVISVGMNTAWGKMMSSITSDFNEQTPLQSRLKKLNCSLAKVGLAAILLDFVITLIRYSTGYTKDKYGNWDYKGHCTDTNDILISFIRAVVATAEGMPLSVVLTLAFIMKRMMANHAMVRRLSACENMGSVTVICTDKTGTLTLNQMKVNQFWLGLEKIEDMENQRSLDSIGSKFLEIYHQGVGLNTTCSVYKSLSGTTPEEYAGSSTEKAILTWAVTDLGIDMEKLKQDYTILHVETFNSEKKRSGVSIRKKQDGTIHVHWKGAAEILLAMCSNYYQKNGLIKSINHKNRRKVKKIIQGMAASSLGCIAFAHKQNPADSTTYKTLNEEGLTLLAIVGIKDPCRPGVKEAIDNCRSAGVEIKMITGDNIFAAQAIATECGILKPGQQVNKGEVVEGKEFRNYSENKRMEKVDSIRVMARSSPRDKLLMMQCLKKKGCVVAIIGHDTYDALALKEADIGLSLGIQGTEMSKENSDIVISNDGFNSVVMTLTWGRCVQNNIQKFIQFQLTANVVALVINFVKAASTGGVPLIPVQQLWVNLIVNTAGALALAREWPTKGLMYMRPVDRGAYLVTNVMCRNVFAQSLYQIVILSTFEFRGRSIFKVNAKTKDTMVFNTFVLCQMFNLFNSRKLKSLNIFKGLHKNQLFLGIIGMTIIFQVMMVEFLKNFADTEKLNGEQWGICIAVAALSWPVGWFMKLIPVPEKPFLCYIRGWI